VDGSWHPGGSVVTALGVFFEIAALLMVPLVLLRQKEPSATIAWILTLIFLPALGAVLFVLFGRDRVRLPAQRKREWDAAVRAQMAAHAPQALEAHLASDPALDGAGGTTELERALFRVGAQLTHGRPSGGNAVQMLFGGDDAYAALGAAIDAAKHHVHAEFYLIRNDATGSWFRERLVAAASRGVKVRLLCDGFGCFALGSGWSRPLKRAGGSFARFLPMRSVLLQPVNLRNHRKIVVVDGSVGFTGGINVGDEYRGTMPGVGEWRDVHMCIRGRATSDLQRVFLQDWAFATGEIVPPGEYFPDVARAAGDATLAIVPSGPDTRTEAIHRLFFGAIAGSRDRVVITTPYFVPDAPILVALELAAMRGVDVRILLPHRSNHRVTFHAGRSFYDRLIEAGVHVYEYLPGMVHAKTMVVDGALALVGSANMDLRSFRLNFEVGAMLHDADAAARLEESFAKDIERSALVTLDAWRARPVRYRFMEGASRLISPLL
jgi:cardiolipin synthase